MGCFDLYCCFCAGPFDDARCSWLRDIRHWRDQTTLSFPTPHRPQEDIVTISEKDGEFWVDWVCVGPLWSWVSPPCEDENGSGGILVDGSGEWQTHPHEPYLTIHRACLSFLCRRINVTPRDIWESLYRSDSDYRRYGSDLNGLLYCLEYHDMEGRNGQFFGYSIERQTPRKDGKEGIDRWFDPSSMHDLSWILARPTALPIVPSLSISISTPSPPSPPGSRPACMQVFSIPELLDLIIDYVISHAPQSQLGAEMKASTKFTPPSVTLATETVFSLLQTSRDLYNMIVRDRQHLFVRLAWELGWILPATPLDWKDWPNGSFHNGTVFHSQPRKDWRAYLLIFLRKTDPHVRNRWRLHKMYLQFARGKVRLNQEGEVDWSWSVGGLGTRTNPTPPRTWSWEQSPET